jgi:hypothetical protein
MKTDVVVDPKCLYFGDLWWLSYISYTLSLLGIAVPSDPGEYILSFLQVVSGELELLYLPRAEDSMIRCLCCCSGILVLYLLVGKL